MSRIRKLDDLTSRSRVLWIGLGQLALAALGVHLAADHLDDYLFTFMVWGNEQLAPALAAMGQNGLTADQLQTPAAWAAVGVELLADLYLFLCIALTAQAPTLSWSKYKRSISAKAILTPLLWAPMALAGSWVVGMAVEDTLASVHPLGARVLGLCLAAVVAWRLGASGLRRVVGALEPPKRRSEGWGWAFLVLPLAALAIRHGLPLWGWL